MLACWDCKNLATFTQVSERGDARELTQSGKSGTIKGPWDRVDDRTPGLYCPSCGKPLGDVDIDALELSDDRVDFVSPADFEVEALVAEVMAIRNDAEWSRFDLGAHVARSALTPEALHPALVAALERSGRLPLYTHQATAIDAALGGANVIQATSAGSGKSLGLLLPVLDACLRTPAATALVLYPLRALANDQLSALARLGTKGTAVVDESALDLVLEPDSAPIRVARYDGSTLPHEKKRARDQARILITTPDSLHASILRMAVKTYADKSAWARLLRGLHYVVLDEIHSYQGVFGSAVAQVIRRLRRVAAWYSANPQFLAASATIGNPIDVAQQLTGVGDWILVDDDGSPRRARTVLVCNPPAMPDTPKKGKDGPPGRVAPQTLAIDLVAGASLTSESHPPVRTICFARSRLEVFALTKRLQGRLKDLHAQHLVASVAPYAATLLASDRITAEGKLRDGTTLAVVSTNALELGIDVPELSIAILCGYPGQISSFRQRAGRVGRVGEGLVVLIVGDDPLQQFIAHDPTALESLLAGKPEEVVLNAQAPEIVRRFGLVPAQEDVGGIAFEDRQWFGDAVDAWLEVAAGPPDVTHRGIAYWRVPWDGEAFLPLRSSTGGKSYTVVLGGTGGRQPIGTIDAGTAPRDAFVPAIWSGPEDSYRVVGLDHTMYHIICEGPVEANYLTRGVAVDSVTVQSELAPSRILRTGRAGYGVLGINRQVFSYKQINLAGGEQTKQVESPKWPPVEFVTEGMHLHLDPAWTIGQGWDPPEAVKGLEHVLLSLAPVVVACDPYDLDATSDASTLYLYDSFGGGIGITRVAFERLAEIVAYGERLICSCACDAGCPSCVLLSRRPDGNSGVSKAGALQVLTRLAEAMS